MINKTTNSCCTHPRKLVQKEVKDRSRQSSVQKSLEILKMNTKLQAGKDTMKNFPRNCCKAAGDANYQVLLQLCRISQVSGSATWVAVSSSSAFVHHLSLFASAPLAHSWIFRNITTAADTFQISSFFKSEPTRMTRTDCKERFRTEAWPPLAVQVD